MAKQPLYFKQLALGPMGNFIYLLGNPQTHVAAVVDPSWDVAKIVATAREDGYRIEHVLLTHGHPDHVNGVEELVAQTKAKIYLHRDEKLWLGDGRDTAILTDDGCVLDIGGLSVSVVHTPGHTPGSQCFVVGDYLISGDTLFVGGCGRTDLPGGDARALYASLRRLVELGDHMILCSGHDYGHSPTATMGAQKLENPYLQFDTVSDFVDLRQPDAG